MSTQTAEKIYKEIKMLKEETRNLRELFFLVLKDSEGEYRDPFVKRVLMKSKSKFQFIFTDKNTFLKQISS
ncbi:MAG: hypothetical protein Q7S81_01150 [bacterium]|nr:hypothetical protein [bacterium]